MHLQTVLNVVLTLGFLLTLGKVRKLEIEVCTCLKDLSKILTGMIDQEKAKLQELEKIKEAEEKGN